MIQVDPESSAGIDVNEPLDLPNLSRQIAVFHLGEFLYGIPIKWVAEVLEERKISLIPGAPRAILGVINHHGKIVTVFDLKFLLGIHSEHESFFGHIIIIQENEFQFGLKIGKVSRITYYQDQIFELAMSVLEKSQAEYIKQVFQYEQDKILMVDVDCLLKKMPSLLTT